MCRQFIHNWQHISFKFHEISLGVFKDVSAVLSVSPAGTLSCCPNILMTQRCAVSLEESFQTFVKTRGSKDSLLFHNALCNATNPLYFLCILLLFRGKKLITFSGLSHAPKLMKLGLVKMYVFQGCHREAWQNGKTQNNDRLRYMTVDQL